MNLMFLRVFTLGITESVPARVQICDFDSIARANCYAGPRSRDIVSVVGHPDTLYNSISRWQLHRAIAVRLQPCHHNPMHTRGARRQRSAQEETRPLSHPPPPQVWFGAGALWDPRRLAEGLEVATGGRAV